MKNIRLRLLSNVVIAYLLVALAWWSILLFTKNKDAFVAKANYIQLVMAAEGGIQNRAEFEHTTAYLELQKDYKQDEYMILGEAFVFVISLVIGIYLINRGYNKEILAAQERRNFLLSITHELKSPISSIRLVLETFIKRNLKPEQINKFSGTALEETERLTKLVEDLLLAAKMESSYQPFLEKLDITQLSTDLIEQLKVKYPTVQFSFLANENIPLIMADKVGITSVTLNLLENAVKYSPKQAKITFELEQKGDKVWLKIADQGMGISEKEKKKIFEKFYRVGNEDTRATKGTGLGLYIVNEIIKAHQGKITVADNQPQGTVFMIMLPFSS